MRHGTQYGYGIGCRCSACRGANAAAQRRYQERKRGGPVPVRGPSDRFGEDLLSDLLHELFPDGLTDDCPARRAKATA
jgi:hypothetical protein